MRIVIVTIRVASAINTSVYVNISANVTIAAPPVEEVDNLAALTGFILSQRAAFVNSFDRAVFCCPERSDT